jgi:uncharacterized protein YciI
MPQYIYILQLTPHYTNEANWTDDANRIVGEHFAYLTGLYEKGVVKFVGKTEYGVEHPDNRGIAIFEAADMGEATRIMQNDPCIINGVMTAKVHPFRTVYNSGN